MASSPSSRSLEATSDLRSRILAASIELFATRGFSATSVRAVVEAVGCTKPALYYHFGSKAELFVEVHREVQRMVTEVFDQLPQATGSLRTRLETFVGSLFAAVAQHPVHSRLLLTAAHRPDQGQPELDLESFHQRNLQHLGAVLAEGQRVGAVRSDISAFDLSELLLGMVHQRALGVLIGKPPSPEQSRQIIDVFIDGARP